MRFAPAVALSLVAVSLGMLPAVGSAQVVGGFPQGTYPGLYNPYGMMGSNGGFSNGMNGVSGNQLGAMMGMRMLQGYAGYHGVQTGVANPIMGGGYGSVPQLYYDGPPASGNSSSSGKAAKGNSQSKRDAARAQRAEEKRAAAAAKAAAKKKPRNAQNQQ